MKLQSQISRKYKNTEYKKFWIIIPDKILKELGWKTGEKLEPKIKERELIIKKL